MREPLVPVLITLYDQTNSAIQDVHRGSRAALARSERITKDLVLR